VKSSYSEPHRLSHLANLTILPFGERDLDCGFGVTRYSADLAGGGLDDHRVLNTIVPLDLNRNVNPTREEGDLVVRDGGRQRDLTEETERR
jgi:hypothetical protein